MAASCAPRTACSPTPPVPGAVPGSTVQAIPTVEYFSNGEIVRVTNNPKYAGLYVVIADKGEKVNLAKLGGDEGYLRSPKRGIVRVALKDALREMGE